VTEYRPVEVSGEHGNDPAGSIIYRELLDWMRNCELLKQDPAPWS